MITPRICGSLLICDTANINDEGLIPGTSGSKPKPYSRRRVGEDDTDGEEAQYDSSSVFSSDARVSASSG